MSNQPRVVKVLAALLISMTTGAVLLMALGDNPPPNLCFVCLPTIDSIPSIMRCNPGSTRRGAIGAASRSLSAGPKAETFNVWRPFEG
jgi:hypothetical protein